MLLTQIDTGIVKNTCQSMHQKMTLFTRHVTKYVTELATMYVTEHVTMHVTGHMFLPVSRVLVSGVAQGGVYPPSRTKHRNSG